MAKHMHWPQELQSLHSNNYIRLFHTSHLFTKPFIVDRITIKNNNVIQMFWICNSMDNWFSSCCIYGAHL